METGEDQSYHKASDPSLTQPHIEVKDVYIAVMGVTGAGKSSLISMCTDKNVKIGHNLKSCE